MTEIGPEQPLSVSVAKRKQSKGRVADPPRAELIRLQHGPMRKQQHQPRTLQPVHQEAQRFKRHGIGPVQILDNDQKRRQGQTPFEDGADRKKYLPPELLGLDMLQRGVRVAETENVDKSCIRRSASSAARPSSRQRSANLASASAMVAFCAMP